MSGESIFKLCLFLFKFFFLFLLHTLEDLQELAFKNFQSLVIASNGMLHGEHLFQGDLLFRSLISLNSSNDSFQLLYRLLNRRHLPSKFLIWLLLNLLLLKFLFNLRDSFIKFFVESVI